MAFMRIYCDYCGMKWEIYQRDDYKSDKSRKCPHCTTKIDRNTWNNHIVPAFEAFQNINTELINDNMAGSPRFSVDFHEDYYFPAKKTQLDNEE